MDYREMEKHETEIRMRCMEAAARIAAPHAVVKLGNEMAEAVLRLDRNEPPTAEARTIRPAEGFAGRQYDAIDEGQKEVVTPKYPSSTNGFISPGDHVMRDWDEEPFGVVTARCDGAVMVETFKGIEPRSLWHVSRLRRVAANKDAGMPF